MRTFVQADVEAEPAARTVFVVDDEYFARSGVRLMLQDASWRVEEFSTCEAFLTAYQPGVEACLVLDLHLPGMGGLELLERLGGLARQIPVVVISGSGDVDEAVQCMKAGACDFLQKPIADVRLVASVTEALKQSRSDNALSTMQEVALEHIADLTPRQLQIMGLVLAGQPSKNIAADLGISQRTVENHRASIMHKTGVRSLPALAKLALSSVWRPDSRVGAAPSLVSNRG